MPKTDSFFCGMFVGMIMLVLMIGIMNHFNPESDPIKIKEDAIKHNAAHYEATDKGEAVFTWGPKK